MLAVVICVCCCLWFDCPSRSEKSQFPGRLSCGGNAEKQRGRTRREGSKKQTNWQNKANTNGIAEQVLFICVFFVGWAFPENYFLITPCLNLFSNSVFDITSALQMQRAKNRPHYERAPNAARQEQATLRARSKCSALETGHTTSALQMQRVREPPYYERAPNAAR